MLRAYFRILKHILSFGSVIGISHLSILSHVDGNFLMKIISYTSLYVLLYVIIILYMLYYMLYVFAKFKKSAVTVDDNVD